MIYTLKNFDTPLIRFQLENEPLKGAVCDILWQDTDKNMLFPIGMEVSGAGMISWLKSRAIPKNRGYAQQLLKLNIQNRARELLDL